MTGLADDDVVVNGDAQRLRRCDDRLGHVDIGARRCRVAGWMVVDQDQCRGGKFERPLDDFTRIDRRMVDRPGLLHLVGDQHVLLVEEQDAELLTLLECHRGTAIVHHLGPGRQHRAAGDLALQHALCGGRDHLEFHCDGGADAGHFLEQGGRRSEHLRERTEARQKRLGQRLGVGAGNAAIEHELQQFVVGQRRCARVAKPVPQPFAVPEIVRLVLGRARLVETERVPVCKEAALVLLFGPRHGPPVLLFRLANITAACRAWYATMARTARGRESRMRNSLEPCALRRAGRAGRARRATA